MSEPRMENEEAYAAWIEAGERANHVKRATGNYAAFGQERSRRFSVRWREHSLTGLSRCQLYDVLALLSEATDAAWRRPQPGSAEMMDLAEEEAEGVKRLQWGEWEGGVGSCGGDQFGDGWSRTAYVDGAAVAMLFQSAHGGPSPYHVEIGKYPDPTHVSLSARKRETATREAERVIGAALLAARPTTGQGGEAE